MAGRSRFGSAAWAVAWPAGDSPGCGTSSTASMVPRAIRDGRQMAGANSAKSARRANGRVRMEQPQTISDLPCLKTVPNLPSPKASPGPTPPLAKRSIACWGIMAKLRSPEGCPWDLEQDLDSLRPYLLEETYEVLEAMDARDLGDLRVELGDLLFQIVFQSRIAEERGAFTMTDVVDGDRREAHPAPPSRLRRRERQLGPGPGSPLGRAQARGANRRWRRKALGARWRPAAGSGATARGTHRRKGSQRGLRLAQPGRRARQAARGARRSWTRRSRRASQGPIQSELGDVLFTLCNLARWLKTPAEDALREAIARFEAALPHVETGLAERGKRIRPTCDASESDRLWREAKQVVSSD